MADYPISNVDRRVQYVNSGVGPYLFSFEVLVETDIAVYRGSTLLTLTSDYTVTINANGTGSVTLTTGGTGIITIVGARAIERTTDFTTGGDLFANVLNQGLDSQTIFSQQLAESLDRTVRVPEYTASTVGLEVSPEANALLGWDSTGTNLINIDAGSLASIATYATAYADVFVSDGIDVTYTLSRNPGSLYNLDISVDGVTQEPVRDYSLLGTVVTFTSALPINSRIVIKYKEGLPNVSGDSQDIRYLPAGTGAVATTVQAKLRETVSVKDFGAVGDGVTDDTAAIQAAIDTGNRISIPRGTYVVTNTLTINTEGQEIIGESMMYTVIKCTNAALTTPVIRTNPTDSRFWGLVLSDFKVEVPTTSTNDVIEINSPNWRCTLNRLWLRPLSGTSGGTAIHFRRADPQGTGVFDGYFTTVQECFIEQFARGVWYDNVDGGMNCNWMERTSIVLCTEYGVYIEGGSNQVISKNHLEQNAIHVFIENAIGCVVNDNYMERSDNTAIKVEGGNNHTISSNYIAASYLIDGVSGAFGAIEIDDCVYFKVSENNFNEKFVDYFVAVYALARGTLILNNTCRRRTIYGGIATNATVNIYDAGASTINIRPVMDGSGNITYQQNGATKFNNGLIGPLDVTAEVTTPIIGNSATVNFTPDTTWTTIATINTFASGLVTATVNKAGSHLTATAIFSASFGTGSVVTLSSAYTVANTIEFQAVTSGTDTLIQVRTSSNFTTPEQSYVRVLLLKV